MDWFMPAMLLILFVITAVVVTYLIYDYLQYKEKVDETIKDASNQINREFNKVIDNVSTSSSNILLVDQKVNNYNESLKHFFSFNSSNDVITNSKMFDHAFAGIVPNLKLLTEVTAVSGLNVHTSKNLIDNKNMQICSDTNGCVNMNVNDNGFNITPNANVSSLNINSKNGNTLSHFDLQNNSIFLGGNTEENAPFYIQNNNVFIKNASIADKAGVFMNEIPETIRSMTSNITENRGLLTNNQNNILSANNRIAENAAYIQDLRSGYTDLSNKDVQLQSDINFVRDDLKKRGIVVFARIETNNTANNQKQSKIVLEINTSLLQEPLIGKSILVKIPKNIMKNYQNAASVTKTFDEQVITSVVINDTTDQNALVISINPSVHFLQTGISLVAINWFEATPSYYSFVTNALLL